MFQIQSSDREVIARLRNCVVTLTDHGVMLFDTSLQYAYDASSKHSVRNVVRFGFCFSNSSSSNKGNDDRDVTVFGYLILISIDFYNFFPPFSLYSLLKTVFDQTSKHLDVHEKYSAARHLSNCLLGV